MKSNPTIIILFLIMVASFSKGQGQGDKEQLVLDYYEKGVQFRPTQKDSAYHYFEKAQELAIELGNYDDALYIMIELIKTSGRHSDLDRYAGFLIRMNEVLHNDSILRNLKEPTYFHNRFLYEEGKYLFNVKDYDAAKERFWNLYNILLQKDIDSLETYQLTNLTHSTSFLASIYMEKGKYDLAESYYNKALAILNESNDKKVPALRSSTQRLLTEYYIRTGQHPKAQQLLLALLESYKKAYEKDRKYRGNVLVVYQRMVKSLIKQDSFAKALRYLDESERYFLDEDSFRKQAYMQYGEIYTQLNEFDKAEKHYEQALKAYQEYRNYSPHQDIAEVYGQMAYSHLVGQNYSEGLKSVQKALNTSGNNLKVDPNLDENPNPMQVFSKRQLLYLLDIKVQILMQAKTETGDSTYNDAMVRTIRDLLDTFDVLKKEFDSKLDKQFLAETAYPIFHRMLDAVYGIYENSPDPKLVQLALNISEKNKDFLLLEALRNTNATRYGKVPKEIIDRETRYRAQITQIEKQQFESRDEGTDFFQPLFEVKQEYYSFLDSLEVKYPKYHELKYGGRRLDLGQIRTSLVNSDKVLISFSETPRALYAIAIDQTKCKFLKTPFSLTDKEMVEQYYQLLSSPSINGSMDKIVELGGALYDKILKEPLKGFEGEDLSIIPDGILHYLPFDMLMVDGSYLLERKIIGYGNSITSLLELKEKKNNNNGKLLAYAPSFDQETVVAETRLQFGRLLYNDDEVGHLEAFHNAQIHTGGEATLANFKNNAPNYNLIHLATHASANDEYPDYSYLAFSKQADSSEGNILYVKDLYQTDLNADMVTLSACQTGIGKLQKGQGMMSLSKGFYYAGAKSLVNTLWKINDKSTVQLMEYFYEGLKEGKSKKRALRDAKLKYLQNTDDNLLRHPYYWSAFVVSGDMAPIAQNYFWWYVIGGALLLGLFLLVYFKKRA